MSFLDWIIAVGLNAVIIAYGFYLSRGVRSSADWFLAGRKLPWWLVGLSMYATAIDSSDLVADSGGTYLLGMSYFSMNWVGSVVGWSLAAFFIFLPMYRKGLYTNAEYLETRYGTTVRVICAFVQVQYRTLILGIIGTTLFLTLSIVCSLSSQTAWILVVLIAAFASIYTAFGGLRSVAITDSLQFVVMTIAALLIWFIIWGQVGGWAGIEQKLNASDPNLSSQLLHVSSENIRAEEVAHYSQEEIQSKLVLGGTYNPSKNTIDYHTPAWLVSIAFILIGMAYSIVNHTQSMRMFAAKSEWDLKMSVFAAGSVMLVMTFFNLSMGIVGRALYPDQSSLPNGQQDSIYPVLVNHIEGVGLKGVVLAGILAAAFSTYDSIGSALSALLTRDVYARLVMKDKNDRHYLRLSQCLTPVIIGISFLYIPGLLKGGMVFYYVELTSAFVIPLLTIFLVGRFTQVHRSSGLIGLLMGASYGFLRLLAPVVSENFGIVLLPPLLMNTYAAYPLSMVVTAGTMVLTSLITGWESKNSLSLVSPPREGTWLQSSLKEIQKLQKNTAEASWKHPLLPIVLCMLLIVTGFLLTFVVFW